MRKIQINLKWLNSYDIIHKDDLQVIYQFFELDSRGAGDWSDQLCFVILRDGGQAELVSQIGGVVENRFSFVLWGVDSIAMVDFDRIKLQKKVLWNIICFLKNGQIDKPYKQYLLFKYIKMIDVNVLAFDQELSRNTSYYFFLITDEFFEKMNLAANIRNFDVDFIRKILVLKEGANKISSDSHFLALCYEVINSAIKDQVENQYKTKFHCMKHYMDVFNHCLSFGCVIDDIGRTLDLLCKKNMGVTKRRMIRQLMGESESDDSDFLSVKGNNL